MEHIIKQLKKGAKHTRLSVAEKAEMKSVLFRHVKTSPVQDETFSLRPRRVSDDTKSGDSPTGSGVPSPFFSMYNFRNKKTLPIFVIAGLLMGSSVSFAAEGSVPGDVLYPIKIQVNERVLGAVAVTPQAQAMWDVRLVERRLEEVERIAVIPGVLLEVQHIAQSNLEKYTNRVKARIEKFEQDEDSEDAIITAEGLASTLRNHEGLLAGLDVRAAGSFATNSATAVPGIGSNLSTETTAGVDATFSATNTSLIQSVLFQLHTERGDAEKKHKELEHKYHPKVRQSGENQDEEGIGNNKEVVLGKADSFLETREADKTVEGTFMVSTTSTTESPVPIPVIHSFGKETIPEVGNSQEIRSTIEPSTVSTVNTETTPVRNETLFTETHFEVSKKVKDND